MSPALGHDADLGECVEDVAVERLRAVGSVESFDVGILSGFAWLDKHEPDSVLSCPDSECVTDEFGPTVESQASRCATYLDKFIERPDDTHGRQARVDLDAQGFAVKVINHI